MFPLLLIGLGVVWLFTEKKPAAPVTAQATTPAVPPPAPAPATVLPAAPAAKTWTIAKPPPITGPNPLKANNGPLSKLIWETPPSAAITGIWLEYLTKALANQLAFFSQPGEGLSTTYNWTAVRVITEGYIAAQMAAYNAAETAGTLANLKAQAKEAAAAGELFKAESLDPEFGPAALAHVYNYPYETQGNGAASAAIFELPSAPGVWQWAWPGSPDYDAFLTWQTTDWKNKANQPKWAAILAGQKAQIEAALLAGEIALYAQEQAAAAAKKKGAA